MLTKGCLFVLMRMRSGEDAADASVEVLGRLMAMAADMFVGPVEVADEPENSYGPDPILLAPKVSKGTRLPTKPYWQSKNPPPARSTLPRAEAAFAMLVKMQAWFGAHDDDLALDQVNVPALMARLQELEAEGALDEMDLILADATSLFTQVVGARRPVQLRTFVPAMEAFARIAEHVGALLLALGEATDEMEARQIYADFQASYRSLRAELQETAPDGSSPAAGRGARVHAPAPPRRA